MCINLIITLILSRMNVEHAVEEERAALRSYGRIHRKQMTEMGQYLL